MLKTPTRAARIDARRRAAPPPVEAGTAAVLALAHAEEMQRLAGRRPGRHLAWRGRAATWFALAACVLAAYGLAVAYERAPLGRSLVDSLKIFPSGFPGYDPNQRWQYNFARHLAAAVFLLGSARLLAAVFADRLSEFRARVRRGHAVVCGLGDTGRRSVRALRSARVPVTCIDVNTGGDGAAEARHWGALVLRQDATQLAGLGVARVERAETVVCVCADDATNMRIAALTAAIVQLRGTGPGPSVHVCVADPDLAQLLRGPLGSVDRTRLHFFNASAVWARAMLDHPSGPFGRDGLDPPELVVLGAGDLARATVTNAARRWHRAARANRIEARATITLYGAGAEDVAADLARRYPAAARVCELRGVAWSLDDAFPADASSRLGSARGPATVYCCLPEEAENLAAALDAENRIEHPAPIFLPCTKVAKPLAALLVGSERIWPVVLPEGEGALELLHDQCRDALASEAHRAFLAQRSKEGDFGSRPADRPWDELDEQFRHENRWHADAMLAQLRAVWFEIEPRNDWDEDVSELPESAIEAMAELEHERWCRMREAEGWRWAATRDDRRKRTNLLVPWTRLPENERDLDRALVRTRPALLALAGFRLVRSAARERLARRVHERYLAADPDRDAPAWDDLTEQTKDWNRAVVDHIPVKLARIGCRIAPRALGLAREVTLSPAELEQLAELEHERWTSERLAAGWRLGPRDDVRRTHPSLVPWSQLADEEREKDREVVRAIPSLLASVGCVVVRN
jgi:voltage-gated potassium channel Kch